MIEIVKADVNDLPEILELQKIAYRSEAELVNNYAIQPLTQTLRELELEFAGGVVLKAAHAEAKEKIVGSVRGIISGDTLRIGKLMVHPDSQNQGIGARLLLEIEKHCPAQRCELFTSAMSARNLLLYTKHGYTETRRQESDGVSLVFLEKCR